MLNWLEHCTTSYTLTGRPYLELIGVLQYFPQYKYNFSTDSDVRTLNKFKSAIEILKNFLKCFHITYLLHDAMFFLRT